METILSHVNSPQDVKKLSLQQMNQLASEIRQMLIDSVSESGGHLAANLGVVELTIALHYVFNSPTDKFIWDVGHQSYVHKILTGRKEKMSTLRQFGGISGFPKNEESTHDAFNTGHSSTSISAAMGMALARDIKKENHSVIAITGDGALTGGMCFEALNHAGTVGTDLIVILNDNEMSINKNVGAMASYLNRLRTDPTYSRKKEDIENALHRIPAIGPNIARAAGRFKDMVKFLVVPGTLFEELGFTYIGPVNGHNLDELTLVLSNVRKMKGPILVHVITQKGRGYAPAMKNPDVFHGVGPFDIETGKVFKKKWRTYTEVFGDYIVEKAGQDQRIVAITAAMTAGTGLSNFSQKFPKRFFDVGICEAHAVTMAAGMARAGLKPVVCLYSTFLQRAYDQLIHDVAMQNLPIVFAIDRAGLVGEDGPTHHGVFDLSFLRDIPNFTIMVPENDQEFVEMLDLAFSMNGPVAIRYPRGAGESLNETLSSPVVQGKADILSRGSDLAILAVGRMVNIAREMKGLFEHQGLSVELVNARFVKPMDESLIIDLGTRFERIVTLEDNCLAGGFGSAVLEILSDHQCKADVMRIGIPDEFVEQGKVELLFDYLNITAEDIAQNVVNRWPKMMINRSWGLREIGKI